MTRDSKSICLGIQASTPLFFFNACFGRFLGWNFVETGKLFPRRLFLGGVPVWSVLLFAYLALGKNLVRNSQNWAAKTHSTIASDYAGPARSVELCKRAVSGAVINRPALRYVSDVVLPFAVFFVGCYDRSVI